MNSVHVRYSVYRHVPRMHSVNALAHESTQRHIIPHGTFTNRIFNCETWWRLDRQSTTHLYVLRCTFLIITRREEPTRRLLSRLRDKIRDSTTFDPRPLASRGARRPPVSALPDVAICRCSVRASASASAPASARLGGSE